MTRNPAFNPDLIQTLPDPAVGQTLDTAAAHAHLSALLSPHAHGHRCTDEKWYNPHAGTRTPCRVLLRLNLIGDHLDRLSTAVHDAAHHDPTVTTVARALVEGMPSDPAAGDWDDLDEESREGFRMMARWGIEALAAALDPDSRPELQQEPSEPDSDPADYGYADLPRVNGVAVIPSTPPEATICRACKRPATEHTAGRFSIYGVCP